MYFSYWVNRVTGELINSHSPKDNPSGDEWEQVTGEDYLIYLQVVQFALQKFTKGLKQNV